MNYRRKPEDSFTAIRWLDNFDPVCKWIEKVSPGDGHRTTVSQFSNILVARVGSRERAVGPGEWLVWRNGKLTIVVHGQFEQEFEPVRDCGVLSSPASETDVPQPQASASDASQGNVARRFSEVEAKPAYIACNTFSTFELADWLSRNANEYELDYLLAPNDKHIVAVMRRHG